MVAGTIDGGVVAGGTTRGGVVAPGDPDRVTGGRVGGVDAPGAGAPEVVGAGGAAPDGDTVASSHVPPLSTMFRPDVRPGRTSSR